MAEKKIGRYLKQLSVTVKHWLRMYGAIFE